MFDIIFGALFIALGTITLFLRKSRPEQFKKLAPMQEKMGKAGYILHVIYYSIVPIIFGAVILHRGLGLSDTEANVSVPALSKSTPFQYPEHSVPQEFLQKYPELTDENLEEFFSDWLRWSEEHSKHNRSKDIDSIFQEVFQHYKPSLKEDSAAFIVLHDHIRVNCYGKPMTSRQLSNRFEWEDQLYDIGFSPLHKWIGSCAVTPHIQSSRPVLYRTNEIIRLLFKYMGGIYINGDEWSVVEFDGSTYIEENQKHISTLKKYIPAERVAEGFGRIIVTMPAIWHVELFPNGSYTNTRISNCHGEAIFIFKAPKTKQEKIKLVYNWVN